MAKWWLLWSLFFVSAYAEDGIEADIEDVKEGDDEVIEAEKEEDKGPQMIDGFTPEELEKMREGAETHDFQAEVSRLMDIIINSLYGTKDIFLRELLSNSGDALERARFNSVADPSYLGEQKDLRIRIQVDEASKTLSIEDTGCGMTKQELIDNLGTVAKSGTTNFLEALKEGQGEGDASSLIGQFGVGFYSAFLVADTVIFTTVSADEPDKQHVWQSSADGSFSVVEDPRGATLKRGSRVTLVLKEEASEYLNAEKIATLVKKFSQFMIHPIMMKKTAAEMDKGDDEDVDDEDEEKKPEDDEAKQWKRLNTQHPIWMRPKEEVTEEEYHEFYKNIGKDAFDPLAYTHFVAEGDIEFRSILFIPKRPPHQMSSWGNKDEWKSEIKLFVRRVLVAEEFSDLLPKYLAWVKGVVDSDDLPLNVNREQLQQSKIMKVISKKLTRKVLEMLRKLAKNEKEEEEEDSEEKKDEEEEKKTEQTTYDKFYEEFKGFLNLGCYEDDASRSKLTKLLRFPSTYAEKQDNKMTSLEDYVNRMKEDQPAIYYMAGVKVKEMMREVNLEVYEERGLEVLLLDDPLSENCFSKIYDFEGVKLRSIQKSGDLKINFNEEENARHKDLVTMYKPLIKWWEAHTSSAGVALSKVEVSRRLVNSAAAITTGEWGASSRQERMNKVMGENASPGAQVPFHANEKILEINPNHPAIHDLLQKVKASAGEADDEAVEMTAALIAQAAVLQSNFDLEDPERVVNSVFDLLSHKHGLDPNQPVTEVEIDIPEPEPEKEHSDIDWDDVDEETEQEADAEESEKKEAQKDVGAQEEEESDL